VARLVGLAVNRYLHGQGLSGVAIGLPLGIMAAGVVGSGVLALVAGTIPAQRAAQLPARRAMGDA
jgi:ABC-type lipoprotein release transport system permease subunit